VLNLTVKHGDLLDESADIIVSTANPALLMSGGVNGAILERGGADVQAELQAHLHSTGRKYVEPGTVVATQPGPLACRRILHAVSINALYESDSALIAQTLAYVFRAAADFGATTLAMPALATGYGPLSIEQFAIGLRSALLEFADSDWLHSAEIRLVLWREEDVASAREILEPAIAEIQQRNETDLNRGDPAPRVLGVSEIVLSVRDIPTMRDFYTRVMGFPFVTEACHENGADPDPTGEPTITFLKIAETNTPLGRDRHPQLLVLIDHKRHVFARSRLVGHDVTRSTLNHLAFEISPESCDSWQSKLTSLGLDPRPSAFPAFGAKALFIRDPEGNTLELICRDSATEW